MGLARDKVINKIKKLIDKRMSELGSEPTIHSFEDGLAVNFFDRWGESIAEGAKMLPIKVFNQEDSFDNKNIQIVFSKKGTHVPLHSFGVRKTYILLNGKINFFFENEEDFLLTSLSSTIIGKDKIHGGDTIEDSFVIVIEE